jgi:uncharacterized protein (TIGR03435 family)
MFMMNRGELTMVGADMGRLADMLSRQLGRIVLDQTRLTAKYDLKLKWTPDDDTSQLPRAAGDGPAETAPAPNTPGPSLFTALQEQLGLKLESQKGPVAMTVINHIERPSEN